MAYDGLRKRRSKEEVWLKRVEEWKQSGLSILAWCKEKNLTYRQFRYWKSKSENQNLNKNSSHQFIEIKDVREESGVEVEVGRFLVRLSRDFDPATLCKCVSTLNSVSC